MDQNAMLPRLDDVWQTASGRLVDIDADDDGVVKAYEINSYDPPPTAFDYTTSRLLYRDGVFVGDASSPTSPTLPRILLVGARRFQRPGGPNFRDDWNWDAMQRVKSVDAQQTPTAWQRLNNLGLRWDYSVDLLPPGDDWTPEDAQRAVSSATYLRGVAAGLGVDFIVPLGGKVCKAFLLSDLRIPFFDVGVLTLGYLPLPSPHARESTWWDSGEKTTRLRETVRRLLRGDDGDEVTS